MMIIGFIGGIGCLAQDTLININRACKGSQITIKDLYDRQSGRFIKYGKSWNKDIPTKVRSFDGKTIQLHEIVSAKYSGVKPVYEIVLSDNKRLKATKDHKIMTQKGFIEIQYLTEDHKVMIDTLKPEKGKKKSYKLVDSKINAGFHPYKQDKNSIPVHILTYEAYMNDLSFIDYMDILWNDKKCCRELIYIDRNKYHVHHIDRNHYNNSIENLKIIEKNDHFKLHSQEAESFKNFNQGIPKFVGIKQFPKYLGMEKTYDIICRDPYHNFAANGIVVHNSGKTLSMTRVLHGDHLNNRTIFTNYGLKFEDMSRIIELDKTFFDNYAKSRFNIEHSSVAIDEAHVFIDSRSAMNKKNKMFSKFITQSRKRGVDMYYTTQESSIESFRVSGQVDLRLRKLTDYMVFCKGVWLKGIFYACNDWYDQSYKYLGNKLFAGNHYFNLYDTNQIIDIDED